MKLAILFDLVLFWLALIGLIAIVFYLPPRRRRFFITGISSFLLCFLVSCNNAPTTKKPPSPNVRPIEHAMGLTYVPQTAKRVVTVDTAALDASLALGIKPVGSVAFGNFPRYLGDRIEGIEMIGDGNQPNLEKIVQLQPDLILSNKISSGKIYQRLSRIAPTVLSEGSGASGEWQDNLLLYGEALGQKKKAKKLLQSYKQEVAQLKQQLGDTNNTVVSIVVTGRGRVGFYTKSSFSGSVLQDLGFARPEIQARSRRWAEMVSKENLENLDGDVIFLIYNQHLSDSLGLQKFIEDPIWSQLNAVKQGRIYQVKGEAWIVGRNILAAHEILDDVARAMLDGGDK